MPDDVDVRVKVIDKRRFACLTSSNGARIRSMIRGDADLGLMVSPWEGFDGEGLDVLRSIPTIRHAFICGDYPGLERVLDLPNLEWLTLDESSMLDDFSVLDHLEFLNLRDTNGIPRVRVGSALRSLRVSGYRPRSRDLMGIDGKGVDGIEDLHVVSARIDSLSGIERFASLKRLEIDYCRPLSDLGAALGQLDRLETLRLSKCPRLVWRSSLHDLSSLKELVIDHCGALDNLKFLETLGSLESLALLNVDVLDGDLSPVLECTRVTHFGATNRRGFSPSAREIEEIVRSRTRARGG